MQKQDRIDCGQITSEGSEFRLLQLMRAAMLKPVAFSSAYASVDEYRLLTSAIRSRAGEAQGDFSRAGRGEGGTPYLPVRIQLRGLFIELYIELRPQNADLRIVGFRNTFENGQAPPEAYVRHVRDSAAPPGIRRAEALPFGGGRSDLEAAADVRRSGIFLGRRPLGNAVIWLHRNRDPKCTAHGILVLSEMLCEAARYPALADAISRIWMTGGRLSTMAAA
ncbi:ribosome-inactivating family protein [Streptomyces sp. NBC_00190]|uniref:ribosome-inactivating family protein n=1 Tax=unclassified Streptomyces TaxID=2593676 RepID=UPI002E2E5D1F|nr:ribosome-inactivating family protein [Streptomyces sp. NBC_00190]WSZ44491.1 ribosome-inactivating family protein [Streptomyces sp. NBC_00868]